MKLEVKIHHPSGDVKNYPVHKLVRNNDGWTAHYTIVKNGRHEGRKATVGNNAALIVKTEYAREITVNYEKSEVGK